MIDIQKVKDLNKLAMEELIGLLMTHELSMHQNLGNESKKKPIALKSITKEEDKSNELDELVMKMK